MFFLCKFRRPFYVGKNIVFEILYDHKFKEISTKTCWNLIICKLQYFRVLGCNKLTSAPRQRDDAIYASNAKKQQNEQFIAFAVRCKQDPLKLIYLFLLLDALSFFTRNAFNMLF